MSLFGPSAEEIMRDPCIKDIIEFLNAAIQIPDKSKYINCWIDFYLKSHNSIVCRYFDLDKGGGCFTIQQIEVYGRDTEENRKYLSESINAKNLPEKAKIEWKDNYETFELTYEVYPKYPKALKKYPEAVKKACEKVGINVIRYSDSRIWIIQECG